jgi:hypothetical protein
MISKEIGTTYAVFVKIIYDKVHILDTFRRVSRNPRVRSAYARELTTPLAAAVMATSEAA